jgi:hypothetical protein
VPAAGWYFSRCALIKRYFADASGTQLKNRQYAIEGYREIPLGDYIQDIENSVRAEYSQQPGLMNWNRQNIGSLGWVNWSELLGPFCHW